MERLRRTIINAEYKALGTAHAPQRNAGPCSAEAVSPLIGCAWPCYTGRNQSISRIQP